MLQVAVAVPTDVPSKELRVTWFPHLDSRDARAGEKKANNEKNDNKEVVLEAAGVLHLHGCVSSQALSLKGDGKQTSSVLYSWQLAFCMLRGLGFMEAEAILIPCCASCKQREFTRLACEWRVLLLTKLCFDCALCTLVLGDSIFYNLLDFVVIGRLLK
jgi:hypothetical protein